MWLLQAQAQSPHRVTNSQLVQRWGRAIAPTPLNNRGIDMTHLFVDGLKEAKRLLECGCGLEQLDALIKSYEDDAIETAAVVNDLETR